MTKADRRRLDKVKDCVRPMLERLGILQTHDVTLHLVTKIDAGRQGTKNGPSAAAEVVGNFPYRAIRITCQRKWVDCSTPHEIERAILHETLHPILFGWVRKAFDGQDLEYDDADLYAEENVVDLVTHWLMVERSELY